MLALFVLAALHAPKPALDSSRFAATTEEGKKIAANVQATIAAANAMLNQPHGEASNVFFALDKKDRWLVVFGLLEKDTFKPVYVLGAPKAHLEQMKRLGPTAAGSAAQLLPYARALVASQRTAAHATGNPRVNPVLMVRGGTIEVYELQGGAPPGSVLVGGDFLDRFDATGKFISRTQFHRSVIAVATQDPDPNHPDAQVAGSYHSHAVAEEPTPTDVALVLLHPQLAPMFVIGRSGKAYRVSPNGDINVEEKLSLPRDVPNGDKPASSSPAPASADAGTNVAPAASDGGR